MATYGGFAPGSYNAWALNLITDIFCSAGVARGMQVTAPGGMAVSLGVDPTALDGVVVLPNGGWVRIDQAITYTVPANNGSGTRTDAIVAFLDPTGVANPEFSITYNSNWSNGFTGNGNQQVIALISVAVGAVSIALSNITMNPATAHFGNQAALMVSNTASGEGITATEALGQISLVPYSTPAGQARDIIISAVNAAGSKSSWTFNSGGGFIVPGGIVPVAGGVVGAGIRLVDLSANGQTYIQTTIGTPGYRALVLQAVDSAGVGHNFILDQLGNLTVPNFINASRIFTTSYVGYGPPLGSNFGVLTTNAAYPATLLTPPTVNATVIGVVIQAWNLTQNINVFSVGGQFGGAEAWVDMNGHLWDSTVGGNPVTTSGNTVGVRIFTGTVQPTNATNGDIWINA